MKALGVMALVAVLFPGTALGGGTTAVPIVAQAAPKAGAAGTHAPQRTLTLAVRDPKKTEAIKVGDPMVGKYYEPYTRALAIALDKPAAK